MARCRVLKHGEDFRFEYPGLPKGHRSQVSDVRISKLMRKMEKKAIGGLLIHSLYKKAKEKYRDCLYSLYGDEWRKYEEPLDTYKVGPITRKALLANA